MKMNSDWMRSSSLQTSLSGSDSIRFIQVSLQAFSIQDDNPLNSAHQLHPLSIDSSTLSNSKSVILKSLSQLKASLQNFNQSIINPLLPFDDLNPNLNHTQADHQPILKPISHPHFPKLFALLRESASGLQYLINAQTESQLASQLIHPNQSSLQSRRSTYVSPSLILTSKPQSDDQPGSLMLIENVLREQALDCFRDSDDPNLIMVAAKVMVIDIELDLSPSGSGQVKRCKFTYTFGEEEAQRDEDVDQELLNSLKEIHLLEVHLVHRAEHSLRTFANVLSRLKAIDELIHTQPHLSTSPLIPSTPIDYFKRFRNLIRSYHETYQQSQIDLSQLQSVFSLYLSSLLPQFYLSTPSDAHEFG